MSSILVNNEAESTVIIENEKTKVVHWLFKDLGDHTGWHKHQYDYIVVPLFKGTLEVVSATKVFKMELENGVPYFRQAGIEHDVVNANPFTCAFIEIEFLK